MARRRRAEKRELIPDPKFNSELVARVINAVMRKGKKSTSERVVYGALEEISSKMKELLRVFLTLTRMALIGSQTSIQTYIVKIVI